MQSTNQEEIKESQNVQEEIKESQQQPRQRKPVNRGGLPPFSLVDNQQAIQRCIAQARQDNACTCNFRSHQYVGQQGPSRYFMIDFPYTDYVVEDMFPLIETRALEFQFAVATLYQDMYRRSRPSTSILLGFSEHTDAANLVHQLARSCTSDRRCHKGLPVQCLEFPSPMSMFNYLIGVQGSTSTIEGIHYCMGRSGTPQIESMFFDLARNNMDIFFHRSVQKVLSVSITENGVRIMNEGIDYIPPWVIKPDQEDPAEAQAILERLRAFMAEDNEQEIQAMDSEEEIIDTRVKTYTAASSKKWRVPTRWARGCKALQALVRQDKVDKKAKAISKNKSGSLLKHVRRQTYGGETSDSDESI